MNTSMKHFTDTSLEKISALEKKISAVLRPIKPRPEFIHNIANRINTPVKAAFIDHKENWQFTAMILGAALSLAVLAAIIARVVTSLIVKHRTT